MIDVILLCTIVALALNSHLPFERTSRVAKGYCIVSQRDPKTHVDSSWLARVAGGTFEVLVPLPINRYDRNVPDKVFVNNDRIVALVNGGYTLHEAFFLRHVGSKWVLVSKPAILQGEPSSGSVARIGDYQVVTSFAMSAPKTDNRCYLLSFGPSGLKWGWIPFMPWNLRSTSPYSIELEVRQHKGSAVFGRYVRYKWPFSAKSGFWQLSPVN